MLQCLLEQAACERDAALRRASTTICPLAFQSRALLPWRSALSVKWRITEATPSSLRASVTFSCTFEKSCGDIDCSVLSTGDEPQPIVTTSKGNHLEACRSIGVDPSPRVGERATLVAPGCVCILQLLNTSRSGNYCAAISEAPPGRPRKRRSDPIRRWCLVWDRPWERQSAR